MAWTEEEIRQYHPRDYAPLRARYDAEELDVKNPEKIAGYLLKNMPIIHKNIETLRNAICIAENRGKAEALNYLEDILIKEHCRIVAVTCRIIDPNMFN